MNIKTNRLLIRKFTDHDFNDLYDLLSNEDICQYQPYDTYSYDEVMEELPYRIISNSHFAIELNDTKKVIGSIYFDNIDYETYEFGITIHTNFQHNNYAFEASNALFDYAFNNLNIHRIIAMCDFNNTSSYKLLSKLKMRLEGKFLENYKNNTDLKKQSIWQSTYQFALLDWEYHNIKK